ncbi:response regulator [Curvibacter sp. APW13]|uniref:response regulator n=1 Tax=Curvibacter sp. APW13 TaxID=3077236 RepID=UPI0028DD4177|nr:response regulator [Curvibacter sp. APW13]MDT8989453.1 response regulator [Curvibacter sp. APW13]
MTFRVLIVEDIETKRLSVEQLVVAAFSDVQVDSAASVNSAIKLLNEHDYCLVLLDMSLPTYDLTKAEGGGTPRPRGGMELFAHLDGIGIEVPVIVVSAYGALEEKGSLISLEEISTQLRVAYPGLFRGSVLFDSVYTVWASELSELIRKALKT